MSLTTYSYIPHFLILHFLLAHVFTSARVLKNYWRLDHNVNPREDIAKYGEIAIKKGKITERQLKLLKRNESCHQNLIDNYPAIVAGLVFAGVTGVDMEWVNQMGIWLTVVKIVYAVSYLAVESHKLSYIRSIAWWAGNWICASLVIAAGKKLNQGAY